MAEINWLEMALAANNTTDVAAQTALVNSVNNRAEDSGASSWTGGYNPTPATASAPSAPAAPAAAPSSGLFPGPVPAGNVASPYITPVGLNSPGATPVAQGFELFQVMLENILKAEALRQSAVDQQVNISNLFAQLQKASPSQAANLATIMGMPGLEPNLSYANSFAGPQSTGTFGGKVGTQQINLPFAFSGRELSFLGNNPNVASGIADIASAIGRPDFLQNSMAALIPTGGNLFKF